MCLHFLNFSKRPEVAELQYSIPEQNTSKQKISRMEEKQSFRTTDQPDSSFFFTQPIFTSPSIPLRVQASQTTCSFQSLSPNLFISNFPSFFTMWFVSDFSGLHCACWEAAGEREKCLHVVLLPFSPPLLLSSSACPPLVCFCG